MNSIVKKLEILSASSAVPLDIAPSAAKLREPGLFQGWSARHATRGQRENTQTLKVWLVQSISIFRILAVFVFVGLATNSTSRTLLTILYAFALISDLIDGYLARLLHVTSHFGRVMDLVADKSLAVVSLLYAAERGMPLLPLALIAARDIIMIGMRLVIVDGKQLLPTNRVFGGLMACLLGVNTLILLHTDSEGLLRIAGVGYWCLAVIFTANLLTRFYVSRERIKLASTDNIVPHTTGPGSDSRCSCQNHKYSSSPLKSFNQAQPRQAGSLREVLADEIEGFR